MKEIRIAVPALDLKSLLDNRQPELTFVTNELGGEPLYIRIAVRQQPGSRAQALGRSPRKA